MIKLLTRIAARTRLKALAAAVLTVLAGATAGGEVLAQGWQWPWSQPEERRRPPQPPPVQQPYPGPSRQAPGYPQPPPGSGPGGRSNICVQLEQRLVQEQQRGGSSREALPKLEADIRQFDRTYQQAQAQLERADCYDSFFFSKTLKRSPRCLDLARQADDARRKLSELNLQRQQIMGTSGRSYQDDIIRELARNNCGAAYQQEANRRGGWSPFSNLWQDDDGGSGRPGGDGFNLPFATYRTVCVRLCDGYFFPISFSTLPNHFNRDVDACQNRCAAPAELFYYQNPGGSIDQAISARSQQPYSNLKSAFRYRKEYVQGCSCKEAEYIPSVSDGVPGPARRTDAPTQPPPTGTPRVRTATPDRTPPR